MELPPIHERYIKQLERPCPGIRSILENGQAEELGKAIDNGSIPLKRDQFMAVGILDVAVATGNTDLAKVVLDKGGTVNPYGNPRPIDLAVDRKDEPMTVLLVEAGADIFHRTVEREAPAFRFPEAVQKGIDARWSKPERDRQDIDPSSLPRDRQIPSLSLPSFQPPTYEARHETSRRTFER